MAQIESDFGRIPLYALPHDLFPALSTTDGHRGLVSMVCRKIVSGAGKKMLTLSRNEIPNGREAPDSSSLALHVLLLDHICIDIHLRTSVRQFVGALYQMLMARSSANTTIGLRYFVFGPLHDAEHAMWRNVG